MRPRLDDHVAIHVADELGELGEDLLGIAEDRAELHGEARGLERDERHGEQDEEDVRER